MTPRSDLDIAFFIDGDNLSPNAIAEAFALLARRGTVTLRRAYGGLEKLASLKEVLRDNAVHCTVNQGKGTTDVALVVDVMDLLHRGALPAVVAIGSSDSDFSPLVVRLREHGVRVVCFAQLAKSAETLPRAFHEVLYVDSQEVSDRQMSNDEPRLLASSPPVAPRARTAAKKAPARKAAAKNVAVKKVASKKVAAQEVAAQEVAAQKVAAKKTAARKSVPAPVPAPVPPTEVELILAALPALRSGTSLALNTVVKALHDQKVLGKNAKSIKFLGRFPQVFELTPGDKPDRVRYIGP